MNVNDALAHAQAMFIPEFLFGMGDEPLFAERQKNEDAIAALVADYFANPQPGFSFAEVLDLADRNRTICDEIEADDGSRSQNLPHALPDADVLAGVAALEGVAPDALSPAPEGVRESLPLLLTQHPVHGTVLGVDIETTSGSPDRGYIVNVGWELMDLSRGAQPHDAHAEYCGIPDRYAEVGVPLSHIHHITWDMVGDKAPFRENKELHATLLDLMRTYPYMAHNAAFEDSWFTLNLPGYAEARKAGDITVVDTRDLCRGLDPDVKRLPFNTKPASLESWARRRGTLSNDANEVHLGLDDTDLMLKTVRAEFELRGIL